MNYRSLAIAAVVAWVVDSVYGFLVFGLALKSEFERYPAVFRSFDAVNSMLPLMFGASLIAMFLLAYIFAKGHDGGPGLQEGLRFGVVFGLFMFFSLSISTYVIYNIGRKLAVETACAGFAETVIMGAVLGSLYKPLSHTAGSRQTAGV